MLRESGIANICHFWVCTRCARTTRIALFTHSKLGVQALRFSSEACQPSLATLERFGNTSCSSTFYVLAHIEHHKGIKRGEKVHGV